MDHSKLAAIRVQRRSVGVAIFVRRHLDYTQIRQLSSVEERAQASVVGFVNWVVTMFEVDLVALEGTPSLSGTRREALNQTARTTLRTAGIPVWEASKHELLEAFGVPALKTRKELRSVVNFIWPVLSSRQEAEAVLDATALGLLVATERFLSTDD